MMAEPVKGKGFFKSATGFTLPEALTGIALTGLLGVLTMECFFAGSRVCDTTATYSRLSSDARMGMDRMTRELRNSSADQILSPQVNASSNVLQFRIPTNISSAGRITWSSTIEYRVGGSQGNQLLRRDTGTGQINLISNRVNNVQFLLSGDPPVLQIILNCRAMTADGSTNVPSVLTGMVQFRNPAEDGGGGDYYDGGDAYGGEDYYGDYYGDAYGGEDYYGDSYGETDPYYGDYYGNGEPESPPETWYYMEYYGDIPAPEPVPIDYYGYYGDPAPEPEPIIDYYGYYGDPAPEPEPVVEYYGYYGDPLNWPTG